MRVIFLVCKEWILTQQSILLKNHFNGDKELKTSYRLIRCLHIKLCTSALKQNICLSYILHIYSSEHIPFCRWKNRWNSVSCWPRWLKSCYIAKIFLEILILSLLPKYWDYVLVSPPLKTKLLIINKQPKPKSVDINK